jgi:hypothetical protein
VNKLQIIRALSAGTPPSSSQRRRRAEKRRDRTTCFQRRSRVIRYGRWESGHSSRGDPELSGVEGRMIVILPEEIKSYQV